MKATSIPDLYLQRARKNPTRIAAYEKTDGRWVGSTWKEGDTKVREIAAGLASLGVQPGDRIAILGDTCSNWSSIDMAILCRGGVTVGIYSTCTAEQVRYHLEHSGARVLFADGPAQLAKVRGLELGDAVAVVAFSPVEGDDAPDLQALRETGRARPEAEAEAFERAVGEVGPDDLATIVYTSGTTGPPKGAMLTHGNLLAAIYATSEVIPITEQDVSLAFLPLAHSLQRQANYAGLLTGVTGGFASAIDKLMDEFVEIRPTVQASVPRIWEKFHARLHARVAAASPRRQKIAAWAFSVAGERARRNRASEHVPRWLEARYRLADRLVFRRLREMFGGRVRFMLSGGAPIGIDLLEFFDSIGIRIYEGWGLTETAAPATLNHPGAWRFGTVGRPLPGVRVRIAEDGEIEVFGPNVFTGYYRDEAATAAAFTADGWFCTGDIGEVDDDGFLYITDRKKDLIITSGGKNVSPQNIENLVKRDPLISQAVVIGDRRKYLAALVSLDDEEAPQWCRLHGLPSELSSADLAVRPEIQAHVRSVIDAANAQLAGYEQVKKFTILPRDLTQDRDELTPTLKLKRRVVAEHFSDEIEALYPD